MVKHAETLSPTKKIASYRALAGESFRLSSTTRDEDERLRYLDMAARWNALADELDLSLDRADGAPKSNDKAALRTRAPRHKSGLP